MTDSDKSMAGRSYSHMSRIDLRDEMEAHLHGSGREPARGQWALLWKADPLHRVESFERAAEHYPEAHRSPDTLQSGFVHTESLIRIWLGFTGGQEEPTAFRVWSASSTFIYCEHDVFSDVRTASLSEFWTLVLDENGTPTTRNGEYVKDVRWNIKQAFPFREVGGRIEFWRLHCRRQEVT